MLYKVNEVFETIQGEGSFTGLPAIFIRLQGCPVGCSWCDTKHTWSINPDLQLSLTEVIAKSSETEQWSAVDAEQLMVLFQAQGYQARHVVITGGEPCMYDLRPLCLALHAAGYQTQIETSGTFEIQVPELSWVTVSPKIGMKGGYKVLQSALDRANEIKHPVAMDKHIEQLQQLLDNTNLSGKLVYLQPISQQKKATELAIAYCKKYNWRLSVQVHKYLGIE